MDFERTTSNMYTDTINLGEPALPFNSLNGEQDGCEYIGTSDDLWSPYTKYVTCANNQYYRLDSSEMTTINLGVSIMGTNNNFNNNFEGSLEADN